MPGQSELAAILCAVFSNHIDVTIPTMLFGLSDRKGNEKKDFVFEKFKSQIESEEMKIDSVDEDGLVLISQGEITLKISLDNVRRNYERDKDESHISDLVQLLVSYSIEIPATWSEVKDKIYISFFPNDYDFKSFLHFEVTNEFSKVYVYSGQDKLTWITKNDLMKWGITEIDIENQVNINANRLLADTPISFNEIEEHKLGLIEVEQASLKGALLFAPAMKDKIENDFGFPFYAVLPVRDFCYIFSETDFEFFAARIGKVVVDEYTQSGYPITTEILKFTAEGVEAVGKYPVD